MQPPSQNPDASAKTMLTELSSQLLTLIQSKIDYLVVYSRVVYELPGITGILSSHEYMLPAGVQFPNGQTNPGAQFPQI